MGKQYIVKELFSGMDHLNILIMVMALGSRTQAKIHCLSFIPITVIKSPDGEQCMGKRIYFSSQYELTVHHAGKSMH